MERELLEDAGLTAAEATVYLALLELGRTKSGAIIEKTHIQPSVVFNALHGLQAKGLLTSVKIGKHSRYTASNPTVIRDILWEKSRRFEQVLPALIAKKAQSIEEGAELYEGLTGIQTMFFSMIEDAKEGEEFLYFDAEEHLQEQRAKLIYLPLHARFKEKGIIARGIQQTKSKTKTIYSKTIQLRTTTQTIPPDTSIFRNKLAFVTWSDTPKAILITSEQLANQYTKFWKEFWDKST